MNRHLGNIVRMGLGLWLTIALLGCDSSTTANHNGSNGAALMQLSGQGFTRLWSARVPMGKDDKAVALFVCDDGIHVQSALKYDFALGKASGDLLYFNPIAENDSSAVLGKPVVLKDKVVYVTRRFVEVYTRKGRLIKKVPLAGYEATSGGTGEQNMVFFGDANGTGRIAAVDVTVEYNPVRWERSTYGPLVGTPIFTEGTLYCASESGGVWAMSDTAEPLWTLLTNFVFQTGGQVIADLRGEKYGIFVACADARLYCINRTSGHLKWTYFAPAPLKTAPEITAASVYQYVDGTGLVALDKSVKLAIGGGKFLDENPNRLPRWIAPDATRFLSEDAQYTYVLGTDHSIMALDKKTGQKAFQSKGNEFTLFDANPGKDGIIYAGKENGEVVAIKPQVVAGATGEQVLKDAISGQILAEAR